jgi:hypothetical protein
MVLWASAGAWASEPIVIGETLTIESEILGEERTLLVSTPPGYGQSADRYPVLYMTDGDAHVTHTRGTVDFLARNGLIPQLIIVGVTNTDRTRDLTPTHVESVDRDDRSFDMSSSGGSGAFLDFFERELFPFVDERYRTEPARFFSGHSFGGLFALNAVFSRPEMFVGTIAVSPSLRWDDDQPLRLAKQVLADNDSLPTTLFVSMANEEEGTPPPTALDRLGAIFTLASADGFDWEIKRMPDETHGSVVLRSHYWGLRMLFDSWRLPRNDRTGVFEGSIEDLEAHYRSVAERYGFSSMPPETTVNQLGYQFLMMGEQEKAISLFEYNVENYPKSANVYDSLGEALEGAGRAEDALAAYSKAVELAAEIGDQRLGIFTSNRDRVQEQLGSQPD